MNKSKGLFFIFFIFLLFISSYIYGLIYIKFIPWNYDFTDIIYVLLYFIAVIPLTAFVAEKLVKYSLRKGLDKDKTVKIFIPIMIAVPIILISIYLVDDYREKGLEDVISFNSSNIDYILVNDNLQTDSKEQADSLQEFLSQYQVKKMKNDEWNSDVSNEKGFRITIHSNDKPIGASIYENRLVSYNSGDYYKVVNGPIDMDWVEEMMEEIDGTISNNR
ncbi:hypothetical protein [Ornithinibacillus contaminans]|uniref:hypothetical protein n=1 Tax=Ornithinibacillus contaminans TaxID=694055 RepID=UPI00064DD848|nr:hypothetical protein [Ornithinibacillus contaminans]